VFIRSVCGENCAVLAIPKTMRAVVYPGANVLRVETVPVQQSVSLWSKLLTRSRSRRISPVSL